MVRIRRASCRGTRRLAAAVVTLLAVWGAAGVYPPVAQASASSGPTWTQQAPVTHPPGEGGAMAYDAANRTVVLFGVQGQHRVLNDTWTWDGSSWTKHTPAVSPPPAYATSMAYDAANRTVVLFGPFRQTTWTWDGSTWTKHTPASSPPGRGSASMAYDAATRTVVLFGGSSPPSTRLHDTWTWG
jgi:hypothetical protein